MEKKTTPLFGKHDGEEGVEIKTTPPCGKHDGVEGVEIKTTPPCGKHDGEEGMEIKTTPPCGKHDGEEGVEIKTTPPFGKHDGVEGVEIKTTPPCGKHDGEVGVELKTTPPCGKHDGEVGVELKTTPPFGHPSMGGDCTRVPKLNLVYQDQSCSGVPSPPSEGCPQDGVAIAAHCASLPEGCPKNENVNTEPFTYIHEIPIYRHFTANLPSNYNLAQRARELRKAGNLAEIIFWKQVHKHKFYRIDFDRQRVIGSYIVDFYVKSLSLIVEIDGLSHVGKERYDAERQGYLESLGLSVYRVKDSEVLNDIKKVMKELGEFICIKYSKPPG